MNGGGQVDGVCCPKPETAKAKSNGNLEQRLGDRIRRSYALEAAIPLALIESGRDGRVQHANPAFLKLTRFTPEMVDGRRWCDVLLGCAESQIRRNCAAAVEEQRPWSAEAQVQRHGGPSFWAILDAVPKFDDAGGFSGHFVILTDISREKQLQQQLQESEAQVEQARKEAELASQAKTKFLDAASHDLRQPLQAASLFIAVLQNRVSEEQRRLILDKLQQSLSALENLLKALLDVSELEAEFGQPSASLFPIQELFLQLTGEFASDAAERNLRLRVLAPPFYLRTDRIYLDRLLRNLLGHALSSTKQEAVLLGARRRGNNLRIEVWDTGTETAVRDHDPMSDGLEHLRTGLREEGLEIARAKRIAKLLGSRLTLSSGPGRSRVSAFELPIALKPKQTPSGSKEGSAMQRKSGKVIIVIDDEVSVQESLAMLLADWGHEPVVDGTLAGILDQLAEKPITPDLIIADYQLAHGQIGTKAIEEIRHSCGRDIPAVVLTGDTAPERHISAQQKSYVLLHKPIGPEHLRVILGSLLGM
jgi:PAS domain S-box-containing protein